MTRMPVEEWKAEGRRRFGPKARFWKFVCPACGTVQSGENFVATGKFSFEKPDALLSVLGYSCIGRFTGKDDEGIAAKGRGEKWDKGCNWTLGGLFQIHTLEVIDENGKCVPHFEFAEADANKIGGIVAAQTGGGLGETRPTVKGGGNAGC